MALTKFTITLNETGKKVSKNLIGNRIGFLGYFWSYDKEGNHKIKQAKLSETVYFFTEVIGLPNGTELEFKLYDSDVFLLEGLDDDEFPEDEMKIKTKVIQKGKIRYAQIELTLNPEWEAMLRDDYAYDLELYWRVYFSLPNFPKQIDFRDIPTKEENCLEVEFNDQDLYILSAASGYDFPEMIANDGSPLVIMDYGKKIYSGVVKKNIKEAVKESVDKAIHNIGLAKLEKGMLVNNKGGITTSNKQIYNKNFYNKEGEIISRDLYTNDKVLKNVPHRKNAGNKYVTTKGTSSYDCFTKTGKRVKLLRGISRTATVLDVFSIASFMVDEDATSKSLPIPHPLVPFTNLITAEMEQDWDEFYSDVLNQEMLKSKSEGVEAVKKYINSQKHNWVKGFYWRYLEVSNETVNQLLSGKFRTFEKLRKKREFDGNNTIIYKTIEDDKKGKQYEVHSIFINE